jgi:glycosyltransferase involved in cell wall biosynthesis
MLSVIIPTNESERLVVRTLACLVAGATTGLIREVILADAGSRDETEKVADVAGCRFMRWPGPLGVRPGMVLDTDWVADVERFLMSAGDEGAAKAAAFRPVAASAQTLSAQLVELLRQAVGAGPKPDHGLLLAKTVYEHVGGHGDGGDPEQQLIGKIGRRNIAVLRSGISGNFG